MADDAAREANRRYREANRDKLRAKARQRYRESPEVRERQRRYREANRDRNREYQRQWREANRDKLREQQRRRYAANPVGQRAKSLRERHGLWPDDWLALWAVQGGRCYLCGDPLPEDRRTIHLDHDHRCCPRSRSCPRCRRGLAHKACNNLIGLAGDDPARLRVIARNLGRAQRRLDRLRLRLPEPFTLFDDLGGEAS